MKKKKELPNEQLSEVLFVDDKAIIGKYETGLFFEVGNDVTDDVAEATSILMRRFDGNHSIWKTKVINIKIEDISPEKSLFWLTGGYSEWRSLEHYNRPWCDCYLDFQEEFGFLIINIVKRAKTLGDIREGFLKYLNLPILYDFAICKEFIK